jgi:hypothetical protein
MITLPFKISGLYASLAELHGIGRLEEGSLILEFSLKDAFVGILKSRPREIRISLVELKEVALKRRLFWSVFIIRARRMRVIAEFPGSKGDELRLRFRRRDWDTARELATEVNLHIMAEQLKQLTEANNRSRL